MKMMKGLLAASCLLGLAAAPASAAIQIVSGGKLVGATGVMVGGVSYDVAFVDGTCASVFGVCSTANFAFATQGSAVSASRALLDQVFLDTTQGAFNSNPSLTNGCSALDTCIAVNPYGVSNGFIQAASADNDTFLDLVNQNYLRLVSFDSTPDGHYTFSRFTVSPITPPVAGAVPEPASWAMMIGGFGMIGATMRRRKIAVATSVRFA